LDVSSLDLGPPGWTWRAIFVRKIEPLPRVEATLDVDGAEDLLLREQFLEEVRSLVSEFGIDDVEAALDDSSSSDDTPPIAPY
jgi:hypothetical protein